MCVEQSRAMEKTRQMLTGTKQHFLALDGLRGMAALMVVIFHFMEMAIFNYSKLWIGHGWLAVDFFFCLSGFVIGYAYDDRVRQMGLWTFLKVRLIRLHPMVVFGSVLGLLTLLWDPFRAGSVGHSAARVALLFLTSVALIPYPVMHERGDSLFGLNSPAWSLFWEYVANFAYAILLYRWSRRWLGVATFIAAITLCVVGHNAGNLWAGFNGKTFWTGAARVSFSFLAGLLVYRSSWTIRTKLGVGSLSVLLVLALVMPYAGGGWIREAAVIIVYFPLLVALGAGANLSSGAEKFCRFAGSISYPLYMTHYAVIWSFGRYYKIYKPDTAHLTFVVVSGVIILTGLAYLVMVFYDVPVREFLRSKLRGNTLTRSRHHQA